MLSCTYITFTFASLRRNTSIRCSIYYNSKHINSYTTTMAAPRVTCMQVPSNLCSRCGRLRNSLLSRGRVRRLVLPAEDLACGHDAPRRRHYLRRYRRGAHRAHATRVPPEKLFVAATAVNTSGSCCSCGGRSSLLLLMMCWKERKGRQRSGGKAERQTSVLGAADKEGGADPFGRGKEHSCSRLPVTLLVSGALEQDHCTAQLQQPGAWFNNLIAPPRK